MTPAWPRRGILKSKHCGELTRNQGNQGAQEVNLYIQRKAKSQIMTKKPFISMVCVLLTIPDKGGILYIQNNDQRLVERGRHKLL